MYDRPDHIPASPADRAREALLDDPERSNREIALAVRSTPAQVAYVRRALTGLGVLAPQRPQQRRFPEHAPLPRQPRVLAEGTCVGHPNADAWQPGASDYDREMARNTCRFACHVAEACLSWALSLPRDDLAIYAGTTSADRARIRRQRGITRPVLSGVPLINSLKTCCPACGLPLSGENLATERTASGSIRRRCRACTRRRKTAETRARRAAARGQAAAS